MRTGNISSMTERDWASVRERRAFEQAERENQLLRDDQIEYAKYTQTIEDEQSRVPRAYRIDPIPFEQWRSHADQSIADPVVRGASATNKALLLKVRQEEADEAAKEREKARKAVLAGNPDPEWKIPASAVGLGMTKDKIRDYARQQADLFVANNSDYFRNAANTEAILSYLFAQGIKIPNEECLKVAWLRLRELGLIEERPETPPEPEPTPVEEPSSEQPTPEPESDQLGWDLESGEKRLYKPYEVFRMSAEQYRQAFRVSPRFTRGYFG